MVASETWANVNSLVRLQRKKTRGSLIQHSQLVMDTYLSWDCIGDNLTQSMPRFQLHHKSKSGIVYRERDT